jgi:hypothetical protein
METKTASSTALRITQVAPDLRLARCPRPVHEHLLTGSVFLAQHYIQVSPPVLIELAKPTVAVFAFRTECCSDSQRNAVRLQSGIAFAFTGFPNLADMGPQWPGTLLPEG